MGDVEANTVKTLLHLLRTSDVADAKVQVLDYLLGNNFLNFPKNTIYKAPLGLKPLQTYMKNRKRNLQITADSIPLYSSHYFLNFSGF